MIKKIRAFTLVELIVIVSILGILAAIGFVSYSSYLTWVRDTNRISQLVAIHDGLEMYSTENTLPLPDNYIEIYSSGTLIAYQGYAGEQVLKTIEYSAKGKDPQEDTYFSYYLSINKKSFQLMALLEEPDSISSYQQNFLEANAINYSKKYPKVYGDKLGILTDNNNTPIQEIAAIKESGYFTLGSGTGEYIAHFKEWGSLKANPTELNILEDLASNGGKPNNCLTWIFMNPDLQGSDGTYQLTDAQGKSIQWYCDWTWWSAIPVNGWDNYTVISSWAISNGNFSWGNDIPTESGSTDTNNIIDIPTDELPEEIDSGYVLEQEWDDSDYKVGIDNDQQDELESLQAWDVIQLCGWVKDLDDDGYVFNNIIDYIDGNRSYNGKLIKMFQKEKKGKVWSYQCVEHVLINQPVDFLWRVGYNAEAANKKFSIWNLEVKFFKKN